MSLLKYIERLQRMDNLIQRKATGSPKEFAEKLGIHRSVLMKNLSEMRDLGAKIRFSDYRRSYYYEEDFCLIIGKSSRLSSVKGGAMPWLDSQYPILDGGGFSIQLSRAGAQVENYNTEEEFYIKS